MKFKKMHLVGFIMQVISIFARQDMENHSETKETVFAGGKWYSISAYTVRIFWPVFQHSVQSNRLPKIFVISISPRRSPQKRSKQLALLLGVL